MEDLDSEEDSEEKASVCVTALCVSLVCLGVGGVLPVPVGIPIPIGLGGGKGVCWS